MEAVTCRLLPFEIGDGPHNMAADETMLESAAAGVASLRFYAWATPTLSLGYFQSEATRRQSGSISGLPYVRRPTGGDTLVHHHELTYAFALPECEPWQHARDPATAWLFRMHTVISDALREFDVPAVLSSRPESAPPGFLCFKRIGTSDVLVGADKIVGSAQRRRRGALLQHGAILLQESPFTPALPGIFELTDQHIDPEKFADAVLRVWCRQSKSSLYSGAWTIIERARRADLVESKYTSPAWNAKR